MAPRPAVVSVLAGDHSRNPVTTEEGHHPMDFAQHEGGFVIVFAERPRMAANSAASEPWWNQSGAPLLTSHSRGKKPAQVGGGGGGLGLL